MPDTSTFQSFLCCTMIDAESSTMSTLNAAQFSRFNRRLRNVPVAVLACIVRETKDTAVHGAKGLSSLLFRVCLSSFSPRRIDEDARAQRPLES